MNTLLIACCLLVALPVVAQTEPAVAVVGDASFHSGSLGRAVEYTLLLPPAAIGDATRRFPVLYLLHGLGDDRRTWVRSTDVERFAAETEMIVVIPDAGDNWYCNSISDPLARYEDLIARDLIEHVDATYPTIAERAGRAIDGVSMGGYGALKIGLKHPERFASVGSHSGVLQWALLPSASANAILGQANSGLRERNDPYHLIQELVANKRQLPQIIFCCGEDDHPSLSAMNRSMSSLCDQLNVPHTYRTGPGGHDYDFWGDMLRKAMRDHSANLRSIAK